MKKFIITLLSFAFINTLIYAEKATPQNPNIVFILIDDISYFNLKAYGGKAYAPTSFDKNLKAQPIKTPTIDKLASEGVICTYAYAYGLCEPTRVALMSGMDNRRNLVQPKSLHHSQITFSDVMQKAGMKTGMFGKWKQTRGTKDIPAIKYISEFGWDEYSCFDVNTELQRYINPYIVSNGKIENYMNRSDIDPQTNRRWYGPDIFNRKALEFIEKNKDNRFLLYYPMVLVHDEHKPTPDTKPESIFDTTEESKKNDKKQYFPNMLEYCDKLIGKVIAKIDSLGLNENTLVIVMGDNGLKEVFNIELANGEIKSGGKGSPRNSGERVPLLFRMPGTVPATKQQRHYDAIVNLTDLYPTLLEAANIEIPNKSKIDGISFWKQIIGTETKAHRNSFYKWYNRNNKREDLGEMLEYAQTPFAKYYAPNQDYPQGRFFDITQDPEEQGGKKGKKYNWRFDIHAGANLDELTKQQQQDLKYLKGIIEKNKYVKVDSVKIASKAKSLKVGQTLKLNAKVMPENATRNNVIWHSSNPEIAKINKFGEVEALKKGKATISLYSWEDARPVADGKSEEFSKNGISDSVEISVK